jgi:uncharacterized protein YndB with AHSA1/START domain
MVETMTQGRTIEREIVLNAPPERVFRALTDPDELIRWFMDAARLDLRPGGALHFVWKGYGPVDGRVLDVAPPHRFVFAWSEGPELGETTIAIDLSAEGGGTRLRLVHTGFGASGDWDRVYVDTDGGWTEELEHLRLWLEEGRPSHGGPSATEA